MDGSDTFSLSFLDNSFRKELGYLGTVSGRDEDKIAKAGLTVVRTDDVPYFEEANMVMLCKKLYAQEYKRDCFIVKELNDKWYPNADQHTLYIAEVMKIVGKE